MSRCLEYELHELCQKFFFVITSFDFVYVKIDFTVDMEETFIAQEGVTVVGWHDRGMLHPLSKLQRTQM